MPSTSCPSHLVGSVSLPDAESVFRAVAEHLGTGVKRIPDGEVGERFYWIQFQTSRFDATDGLSRLGDEPVLIRGIFDQRPFLLEREDVHLPDLGYADAAVDSYAAFATLRDAGVIPAGVRFQVSIPTPGAVVGAFFEPGSRAAFEPIYEAAIIRELDAILASIPHDDLAIQWDVAVEFAWLEGASIAGFPLQPWFAQGYDATHAGVLERLTRLGGAVPTGVELGYHLCYGDIEEQHFIQPTDAGVLADVARGILATAVRPVEFIHLPVPIERSDEAYFAPLASVDWGTTEVYLGLVHHEDGLAGAVARANAARPYVAHFGIATECGLGRGPVERTVPLLDLHAEVAAAL